MTIILTAVLGSNVKSTVSDQLSAQSQSHARSAAAEVAAAVEQKLFLVANSVAMVNAKQAAVYLSTNILTNYGYLPLANMTTYREYKFVTGCQPPSCPSDYVRRY